jgi:hypothetical protein
MKTVALAALMLVALARVTLAQQFTPPAMPPGAKAGSEMAEGEILKIYSMQDQGAKFCAYIVKYKGNEVVVGDTLANTTRKVGDKIKFIVARVEMPTPAGKIHSMSFKILPFDAPAKK